MCVCEHVYYVDMCTCMYVDVHVDADVRVLENNFISLCLILIL